MDDKAENRVERVIEMARRVREIRSKTVEFLDRWSFEQSQKPLVKPHKVGTITRLNRFSRHSHLADS